MTARMTASDFDLEALALVPLLALVTLPLVGSPAPGSRSRWRGWPMGMIIFIIASGLTLVFGLMDVLNFGHGVFIALGAFGSHQRAWSAMGDWTDSKPSWRNMVAVLPAPCWWPWRWQAHWAWRLSASSIAAVCSQHLKRSSSPWAA